MNAKTCANAAELDFDDEFADTLIAISVIAKRLAKKIKANNMQKGEKECTERTMD